MSILKWTKGKQKPYRHRQQHGDYQKERGRGGRRGCRRADGDDRRLNLGGEHTL